ncbi:MAG: C25 family cysteine peptidase [Thermoanaerobaculia bacterium]
MVWALLACVPVQAEPRFRVLTAEPGVQSLTFADLETAGWTGGPLATAGLTLSNRGERQPLWPVDGGDGTFGPGDRLEFVAEHLEGAESWEHPYSPFNVYWLTVADDTEHAERVPAPPTPAGRATTTAWRRAHFEKQELLARLDSRALGDEVEPELWFWLKLTHIDKEPVTVVLDLDGLDPTSAGEAEVTVRLRALSWRRPEDREADGLTDHALDLSIDGRTIDRATWNGRRIHDVRFSVPVATLHGGENELQLRIPRRSPSAQGDPIVDVVMLDWVEVRYPHDLVLGEEQLAVEGPGGFEGDLRVTTSARALTAAFDDLGRRLVPTPGDGSSALVQVSGATRVWLLPAGAEHRPRVVLDRPSDWAGDDHGADYLIVSHASLLDAIEPLAQLHRARGLRVAVVDVQDLYDEFNDGIEHPVAIRRFVDHAFHDWQRPAPRYVLLVGDASWDRRLRAPDDADYANWADRQLLGRADFPAKEYTPYRDSVSHALLPTWTFHSFDGHSATDNWFVAVDGDDFYPDLAIGRFPFATPEEVAGVVEKSIRYANAPRGADWQRRTLWVTNEYPLFQERADRVAAAIGARGFEVSKIYPQPDAPTEADYQQQLVDAFDRGQYLVYFNGHGGRFIWRTAAPTLSRHNPDLFTLEHLDALRPNTALPVVLSLACHTGPFDHPRADSIAEKLLRLPQSGAIAVVSASWRTRVADPLALAFAEAFTSPGTIGDAFLAAKRRLSNDYQVSSYNLFGDPALPLDLPAGIEPPALQVETADAGRKRRSER